MLQPSPGKWYLCVVCQSCHRRIFLFPDMSEGKSNLEKSQISVKCPQCDEMTSAPVEHYQQPRKRPSGELHPS